MREPKFRVWDKKRKRMFVATTVNASGCVSVFIDDELHLLPAEQIELMQYTGLKDKNGEEICDGDIVSGHLSYHTPYHIETFEIAWREDKAGWFGFAADDYTLPLCNIGHAEVIGNVYENRELLGDICVTNKEEKE